MRTLVVTCLLFGLWLVGGLLVRPGQWLLPFTPNWQIAASPETGERLWVSTRQQPQHRLPH